MSDKLTFEELVRIIADRTRLSRRFVNTFAHELVNIIQEGLTRDGKVNISHLGIFETKWVEAREGRDPETGEPITIPAHEKVVFKPYKQVRKRINSPYEELEAEFVSEEKPETTADSPEPEQHKAEASNVSRDTKANHQADAESKEYPPSRSTSRDELRNLLKEYGLHILTAAGITTLLLLIGYKLFSGKD